MAGTLWRSFVKRDFQLVLQCLPGLSQAILLAIFFVAHKAFGVVPGFLVSLGSSKANLALMYITALIVALGLARAVHELVRTKIARQPVFFATAALALGLLIYGVLAHSRVVIYSAEVFAIAGMLGLAEALWAKIKGRDAAYDSALGHSGAPLVLSSVIIALAFTGM